MESELQYEYSFRKKVNKCLKWLKEGELTHIFVWGADSETGEGSQIRIWYNEKNSRVSEGKQGTVCQGLD